MKQSINIFLKKQIKLHINWALIIFYLIFFSYRFYGVISKYNNLLFTIITILNLYLFYFLSKKNNSVFKDEIILNFYDLFNYIFFFIILLIINFNYLNYSLFGDELAHTLRSTRTSVYGLYTLINYFNIDDLDNYEYVKLVNAINFVLLIFVLLTIYILKNSINYKILFFFIVATIFFRFFLKDFGMHPPLDHIFTFFTISIFGLSDFTGNLSYLIGFTFFQVYLFNIFYKNFSYLISFLATVSIFTIPLLLSMSTWAESSIWASLFLTIILLEIFFSKKINYIRIISIISIGTLFRITVFISIIPLLFFFINDFFIKNKNKFNYKNIIEKIYFFLPVLLFIPFLANNILFGTPTFEGVSNGNLNFLDKIIFAFQSKIIWVTVVNSLPYWWIALIPLPFFIKETKNFFKTILFLYLVICICLYYSIDLSVWGMAKYSSEYALPFSILGFIYFINFLYKNNFRNIVILPILLFLIISNIYTFQKIPTNNRAQDLVLDTWKRDIKKISKDLRLYNGNYVFNLVEAFNYIKKSNLQGKTYILGTTYGILPEILNGYKVRDVLITKEIIDNQNQLKQSDNLTLGERINKDQRIKAILITDLEKVEEKINSLKKNNWQLEKKFINKKYRSTTYLLIKN